MKRIMVVDDEPGARKIINIMLDRGGFSVIEAASAAEALTLLEQETPDLIILDIMMGGMDGIALCSALRNREATSQTPILMLSARTDGEAVIKSVDAGATDYISKPIFHHDLVGRVRKLLNIERQAQ
ncbi:MAG: response regulator [Anaerolinea sp.]|nr:response regulator [Anaerolinea sp.]MCC6973025.1 response regulator [Anaerolineae bacterium]